MQLPPLTSVRTARGRRIAAAEAAAAELDRLLAQWDEQRARLVAGDLGSDPYRHVPRSWPAVAESRAAAAGRLATPPSRAAVEAECSELRWSAAGKLIGATLSATVLLSVPVTLVLRALGRA